MSTHRWRARFVGALAGVVTVGMAAVGHRGGTGRLSAARAVPARAARPVALRRKGVRPMQQICTLYILTLDKRLPNLGLKPTRCGCA